MGMGMGWQREGVGVLFRKDWGWLFALEKGAAS